MIESTNQRKGFIMSNISHFMNGRDAFAIAYETHSAILAHMNDDDSVVNGQNVDAMNNYYSLMMHFTMHNDFIDSCAFDSMVEIDNFLELNVEHDVFNWDIDTFETHYKNDVRAIHHYNSLSIHNLDAIHNREICVYCNPDFDMCCESISGVTPLAFTMMDILKAI